MRDKKRILDGMVACGFEMNRPFFWYLEFFTLEELQNLEKKFFQRG